MNKAKSSLSKKNIVLLGFMVLLLVFAASLYMPSDEESDEAESPAVASEAAVTSTPVDENAGKIAVSDPAKRGKLMQLLAAPVYSDEVAAARIIKNALDSEEASAFVVARMSARVAKIRQEASKLSADEAKNLVERAKAEQQLALLKSPEGASKVLGLTPGVGESVDGAVSGLPRMPGLTQDSISSQPQQATDQDKDIRIIGFSRNGRIPFQLGKQIEPNARKGQTIFGRYQIEKIDDDSQCVHLLDEMNKKSRVICYAG